MLVLKEISSDAERYVVALRGDVDLSSAPALSRRLLRAADNYSTIVIDLGAASFIDSSGLNILFNMHRHLERRGGHLGLVVNDPSLLRPLELTGLNRLIPIAPTLARALAQIDAAAAHPPKLSGRR